MDANVEAHQFPELRVCEAELVRIVGSVVKRWVTVRNCSVITVLVSKDKCANARHFRTEINCIFEGGLPQLGLVNTLGVGPQEVALGLAREDAHGKLSHSVHVCREGLDHRLFLGRECTPLEHFVFENTDLRLGGHLSGKQEPQDTLGDRLTAWDAFWGSFTEVEYGHAAVVNAFHCVKLGSLVHNTGDATHATHDLCHGNIADNRVSVLLSEREDFLTARFNGTLHLLA